MLLARENWAGTEVFLAAKSGLPKGSGNSMSQLIHTVPGRPVTFLGVTDAAIIGS